MTGDAPAAEPLPSPSAAMLTPEAIAACLQRLAPFATVDVAGQATVAGREVYLLRFTPTAADTALGAVQASIDGADDPAAAPRGVRQERRRGRPAVRLRQRVLLRPWTRRSSSSPRRLAPR